MSALNVLVRVYPPWRVAGGTRREPRLILRLLVVGVRRRAVRPGPGDGVHLDRRHHRRRHGRISSLGPGADHRAAAPGRTPRRSGPEPARDDRVDLRGRDGKQNQQAAGVLTVRQPPGGPEWGSPRAPIGVGLRCCRAGARPPAASGASRATDALYRAAIALGGTVTSATCSAGSESSPPDLGVANRCGRLVCRSVRERGVTRQGREGRCEASPRRWQRAPQTQSRARSRRVCEPARQDPRPEP